MDRLNPNQFEGVHMNDIQVFEDLLTVLILLYDTDTVDGYNIGDVAGQCVLK